jgi:hypothetical protein
MGLKLAARGGKNAKKRALVAVARKLAILLHRLWVTGEVYEPLRSSQAASSSSKNSGPKILIYSQSPSSSDCEVAVERALSKRIGPVRY